MPAPIDPAAYRTAFSRHAAGVVVVTAASPEGPAGLTATSLISLSLEPPLVAFAVAASSVTWPRMAGASTVVVHMLAEDQHELAGRFATKNIDRFATPTRWETLPTGEPLLSDAPTWLRCEVEETRDVGDHVLVVAQVREIDTDREYAPLVYHDRAFRGTAALIA